MRHYFNNLGLRSKVVLLISAVVFVLLTSVLAIVWAQSHWQMKHMVYDDIASRKQAFITSEAYRIRDRAHIAGLVAAKMAVWVEHPDKAETCRYLDFLLNAQGTDPNDSRHIEYAALQKPNGEVLALAIAGHPTCDPELERWRLPDVSAALVKLPLLTNWRSPEHKVYSVFAARLTRPGSQETIGTVALGYRVDDEAAQLAKLRAGTDVVYWHDEDSQGFEQHLLGASCPALADALATMLPAGSSNAEFKAAGSRYVLEQVTLQAPGVIRENPERIHVGMVESITDRMRPITLLKRYLAALAACSLLIGVGLGLILSRPIVKPLVGLANVVRDVKEGRYEAIKQLKIDNRRVFESYDEIGILCRAFEEMVAALKQRRALSKLISRAAYNNLESSGGFKAQTERKWMAVMFSDIRDFTGFSEGRDPELVVQRLNHVLGIQAEIVSKHGGDVDKFIGDAMVAWFSGPDRCQRAIQAGEEIMATLSKQIGERGGARVGLGVHVGELIVGAIGSRERMDYTAIGSSVNLAARLCSAAKGGQILLSQAVVREIGDAFEVRPMSPLTLKGFADPMPVYEVPVESPGTESAHEQTQPGDPALIN
jgi:class 3 adenylate cyclase